MYRILCIGAAPEGGKVCVEWMSRGERPGVQITQRRQAVATAAVWSGLAIVCFYGDLLTGFERIRRIDDNRILRRDPLQDFDAGT